ncbi:unnamed protein product [marine sediment metagenome]|uniref:Uncharacterized protein n=1 Tax=marine sediment metagenome TaxID=412755 RepID=X0YZ11_9ZZZZ
MKSYNPWQKDREDSVIAINKNIHFIMEALGGGYIYSLEESNYIILRLLDDVSGIDIIWKKDNQIKGIASRVQWEEKPHDNFTIRCKRKSGAETEYKKRLETIGESFGPHLTMQMYCNNREENIFESMAIIKTEDLYLLIITRPDLVHESKSDNFFKYISWDDIRNETDISIFIKRKGEILEREPRLN